MWQLWITSASSGVVFQAGIKMNQSVFLEVFSYEDNGKNGKKNNTSSSLVIGMCIGLSIGTAIGAATQNIGTWMPVGLCLGLALGTVFNNNDNSKDSDSEKKEL